MRYAVRHLVLWVFRYLGVFHVWRFLRRKDVTIVLIHGVMDSEDQPTWSPMRPQLSRRWLRLYMRALSKHYNFISLQEAVDMLSGKVPLQPYSLVFTFDDGYQNNITHAMPILRRYNATATIFLTTGHVDNRKPFWFDRLDYALQLAPVRCREIQLGLRAGELDVTDTKTLAAAFAKQRNLAKARQGSDVEFLAEMEGMASALESDSGRSLADISEKDDWSAVLSWSEIQAAVGDGVMFGSHTVDHVRLGLVDAATADEQMRRSKEAIEAHTNRPCIHLAYPNGSFSAETIRLAGECGYICAVTTEEGTNRPGDDLLKLRRITMPTNTPVSDILARVCGLSHALGRLERR
ncbi:MAG: polysaccharide deacetylase family protein [Planctomycetes bacterium]|nr:polysaccharide deacetylase family protein [Planctomycetota bacterium]